MTRIKGTNVQIGNNFVVPIEKEEPAEVLQLKAELSLIEEEIKKAEAHKQELIDAGHKQAEALVDEARAKIEAENKEIAQKREEEQKTFETNIAQEAEKIKAEAYKTGYEDGYKQGYVVITNELENKVKAVNDFVKCQFDLKSNIIKSSELDIINLVLAISKKVCTKSLELNPELLKLLTQNAIKELKDKENITIIVNPKLMEVINSVSERLKEEIPQLKNIKILEDNGISADGTIVESLLSRVDSRVKSQINEIADKLFEAYNSEDEDFNGFLMSLEDSDISNFENIELSDDANIEAFLNELENIPSYDDKIRDDDAQYYKNLDIQALKDAEPKEKELNGRQNQININDINLDELEEMFGSDSYEDKNENLSNENSELQNQDNSEQNVAQPVFEQFDETDNENDTASDDLSDLNAETFLDENSLLPELEEQNQNIPVKDEEQTGEDNVQ